MGHQYIVLQYQYIFLAFVGLMSLVAFILYAADKAKSKGRGRRIPEKTLLLTGVFGGALGALIAMETVRHKTKHWYFWAVNIAALAAHIWIFTLLAR